MKRRLKSQVLGIKAKCSQGRRLVLKDFIAGTIIEANAVKVL